jgi:hypothetical protein
MPRAHKSGWKWILVAGACAVAVSVFTPFAGVVPVMALQVFAPPKRKQSPEEAVTNLVKQSDLGANARFYAIEAVVKIGKPAVPALIKVMNDENQSNLARNSAAWALGKIKNDSRIIPALTKMAGILGDAEGALKNIGIKKIPRPEERLETRPSPSKIKSDIPQLIKELKNQATPIGRRVETAKTLGDIAGSMTGKQIYEARKALDVLTNDVMAAPGRLHRFSPSEYSEAVRNAFPNPNPKISFIGSAAQDNLQIISVALQQLDRADLAHLIPVPKKK